jgi:hypothetical protein
MQTNSKTQFRVNFALFFIICNHNFEALFKIVNQPEQKLATC